MTVQTFLPSGASDRERKPISLGRLLRHSLHGLAQDEAARAVRFRVRCDEDLIVQVSPKALRNGLEAVLRWGLEGLAGQSGEVSLFAGALGTTLVVVVTQHAEVPHRAAMEMEDEPPSERWDESTSPVSWRTAAQIHDGSWEYDETPGAVRRLILRFPHVVCRPSGEMASPLHTETDRGLLESSESEENRAT